MEKFSIEIQIKEQDLDFFGHVNNARYLELFEQARWDFISTRNFGLEVIKKSGQGPVLLEANLKFKKEILNRETITIESEATGMKNPLIMTMSQRMVKESGDIAAELDIVVGLLDLSARKLIKPTKQWLYAIGADETLTK